MFQNKIVIIKYFICGWPLTVFVSLANQSGVQNEEKPYR